jgi:Protein of unknown function DUF262/Protein of unknown function (DUF1524)
MQITPTSLSISHIFGANNEQYVIPTYQRRYSWHERQVNELIDDILLIEGSDTHLLGSIVCLTGHHKAGLNQLELVDGQQRLTTITILLECIRQRFEKEGEVNEAAEVSRLLTAKPLGSASVNKVALDSIDSTEFQHLVKNNLSHNYQNQALKAAFDIIREWVGKQSLEKLGTFLYRLTNQAIVIRLDVSSAKDAFKLFETINNRGLQLSPTDIIKNFLLGNAARFNAEALHAARESWTSLLLHLDGTDIDAFFRYYLMSLVKTRLTSAEVTFNFKSEFMKQVVEAQKLPERHIYVDVNAVSQKEDDESEGDYEVSAPDKSIRSKLELITFNDFLAKLVLSAKVYGELILVKTKEPRIDRHLRNLRMIKAIQTYGFLMHLRAGGCSDNNFREILKLTENFVLRRHVCRERSNETEALFAKLCSVNPLEPIEATKSAYRELCPSDEKFKTEFYEASFPSNLIDRARYCLEQIEIAKHGDYAELYVLGSENVHVEHIIPQKIKTAKAIDEFGDWVVYLGESSEALHPKYVSRIGNLTIFAGTLNIGASNNPFLKKKEAYENSAIKLTQELLAFPEFKFKEVEQRSMQLAEVALQLWPKP